MSAFLSAEEWAAACLDFSRDCGLKEVVDVLDREHSNANHADEGHKAPARLGIGPLQVEEAGPRHIHFFRESAVLRRGRGASVRRVKG